MDGRALPQASRNRNVGISSSAAKWFASASMGERPVVSHILFVAYELRDFLMKLPVTEFMGYRESGPFRVALMSRSINYSVRPFPNKTSLCSLQTAVVNKYIAISSKRFEWDFFWMGAIQFLPYPKCCSSSSD